MAISQPGQNSLRVICEKTNIPVLDHDPKIGGRYSILSLVGVLPALIAGVNGGDLRDGAKVVLDQFLSGCDPQSFAPAIGAAISVGLAEKKKHHSDSFDALLRSSKFIWQMVSSTLGGESR